MIWDSNLVLLNYTLQKYFIGIFRNGIKIHYKKCFYTKLEIENKRNYGHQKIWNFIFFLWVKKIQFTNKSFKGTFFLQIVKTKVFSFISYVMFLNGNKRKAIFFWVARHITGSFKYHHCTLKKVLQFYKSNTFNYFYIASTYGKLYV